MSDAEVQGVEEGVGEVKLSKKELNKLKKQQAKAAKKAEVSFYCLCPYLRSERRFAAPAGGPGR